MPALDCFSDIQPGTTSTRTLYVPKGDDVVVRVTFCHQDTLMPWDFTGWSLDAKITDADEVNVWAIGATSTPDTSGVLTVLFPKSATSVLTIGDTGYWFIKGTDPLSLTRTLIHGEAIVTKA